MRSGESSLFLQSLSDESRRLLLDASVEMDLPVKKTLYEPETTPKFAYIITSGVASVVASTEDGASAEVGLFGEEAVVGAMHLLGPAKITTRCFIQLAATGLRIPLS